MSNKQHDALDRKLAQMLSEVGAEPRKHRKPPSSAKQAAQQIASMRVEPRKVPRWGAADALILVIDVRRCRNCGREHRTPSCYPLLRFTRTDGAKAMRRIDTQRDNIKGCSDLPRELFYHRTEASSCEYCFPEAAASALIPQTEDHNAVSSSSNPSPNTPVQPPAPVTAASSLQDFGLE